MFSNSFRYSRVIFQRVRLIQSLNRNFCTSHSPTAADLAPKDGRRKPYEYPTVYPPNRKPVQQQQPKDKKLSPLGYLLLRPDLTPVGSFAELKELIETVLNAPTRSIDNLMRLMVNCNQLLDRSSAEKQELTELFRANLLQFVNTKTNGVFVIALIEAYLLNGKSVEKPFEFLAEYNVLVSHSKANKLLLQLMCKNNSTLDATLEFRDYLIENDVQLDENTFAALISAHVKHNNSLEKVDEILSEMTKCRIEPKTITKTELIKANIQLGNAEEALKILQSENQFSKIQLLDIFRTCAMSSSDTSLLQEAISKLLPREDETIIRQIKRLCFEMIEKDSDLYEKLFRYLPTNYSTCKRLTIRMVYKKNQPLAGELLRLLPAEDRHRAIYPWFSAASNDTELFAAVDFAVKVEAYLTASNIVRLILHKVQSPDMLSMAKQLVDHGLSKTEVKKAMLWYYINLRDYDSAVTVATEFDGNIDTSAIVGTIVTSLKNYEIEFKPKSLIQLIEILRKCREDHHYDIFGDFLWQFCNIDVRNDFSRTKELISLVLENKRNNISQVNADRILERIKKVRKVYYECQPKLTAAVGERIKNPEQETDSKRKSTNEATVDRSQANIHQLCTEFNESVHKRDFVSALATYRILCDNKVSFHPAMLSKILETLTATGNVDEAIRIEEIFRKSNSQDFKLDLHKVIDFVSLLVDNNQMEKAFKTLKTYAPQGNVQSMNYIHANVLNLLTKVCEYSLRNNLKTNFSMEVLDNLVKLGYCQYTKILCGVIIKEYIDKQQYEQAVEAFEGFIDQHKFAPHFHTLVKLFIENASNTVETTINKSIAKELLKQTILAARKILKPETANSVLLMGLAECGTDQQIRQILMNPEVQFKFEVLLRSLKSERNSGKSWIFVRLAKCNRGLRHDDLKEEILYEKLLDYYSNENNVRMAKELYETISEDSEFKIGTKLAKKFVDIFKRNEQTIPSKLEQFQ